MASVQADDGDGRYEYVTLPTTVDGAAAKLHLKVAFGDDATADVFRACALVVVADATRDGPHGVYEGRVARDRAAAASRYWMTNRAAATDRDDESAVAAAVGVWLRDARDALVERTSGQADAEYVHVIRRLEADDGRSSVLEMSWKLKLRPVGMVTLGAVRLSAPLPLSATFPDRVSRLFVGPMVRDARAARARRERADREAAENAELLLADNRRLLDALRTADESRRRDERQLMARFAEVLNAKKLRLAAVQLELSELKRQQRSDRVPFVDEPTVRLTTNRRKGRAAVGRGRRKTEWAHAVGQDRRSDTDEVAAKMARRRAARYGDDDWRCSVFPEPEQQRCEGDAIVTVVSRPTDNEQQQPVAMETDNNVDNDRVDAKTVSPEEAVKTTVDDDIFNADTLIDDPNAQESSSNDSLPFFQEQAQVPSSMTDDDRRSTPKKKSVLDDLWSGIL